MPKKLKPVIRYNRSKTDGLFESQYSSHNVAFICLPLTPSSRKAMVAAIDMARVSLPMDQRGGWVESEAALNALINLANEKP